MKQTLPFIILIFCLNSCTTISRLKGEFVSDIGEKIIIQKKGTLINSKKIKESELIVKQRKNILKFKTHWYGNNTLLNRPHKLYFKILDFKKGNLILLPITKWSRIMFENRDTLFLKIDTTVINKN